MAEQQATADGGSRSVRFSESNETVVVEFERGESEVEEAWWPKEVGQQRKESCHRLGRAWQKKGYDVLLNTVFEEPAPHTQSKLNTFAMLGDDCIPRGIERYISSKHAEDRRYCKVHCIESVVDLCTYLRRNGKTTEEIEEKLHNLSAEKSKWARKFARRMGTADAKAVEEEGVKEQLAEESPVAAPVPMSSKGSTKKGISFRAIENTKRFSKMITGHMRGGHR